MTPDKVVVDSDHVSLGRMRKRSRERLHLTERVSRAPLHACVLVHRNPRAPPSVWLWVSASVSISCSSYGHEEANSWSKDDRAERHKALRVLATPQQLCQAWAVSISWLCNKNKTISELVCASSYLVFNYLPLKTSLPGNKKKSRNLCSSL